MKLDELFDGLRRSIPGPPDEDLRTIARRASSTPRTVVRPRRRARSVRLGVAAALVLGSAAGFGLGSWLTPSVTAGAEPAGLGFLPAQGWTVIQSGSLGPTGEARAVAANVPLDADDDLRGLPLATLDSLPERGVVIFATFTPRGDPGHDFAFAPRELPLRIEDAVGVRSDELPPFRRPLTHYRVRASVGGSNVAAEVFLGTTPPPAPLVAAAQRQLNRLFVESPRVTINARRPASQLSGWTLFGSVDSRRAGESVTIQAKDCGLSSFRVVGGATTVEGGGWSTPFYPRISTQLRATWRDETSRPIDVRVPVSVRIYKRGNGRLGVAAWGAKSFWGKRVRIERLDRLGRWRFARTLTLTQGLPPGGSPGVGTSGSFASFKPRLPKGTRVRAVMPVAQARPCYAAGVSEVVRL